VAFGKIEPDVELLIEKKVFSSYSGASLPMKMRKEERI
jgi:hypothetical protein